MSLTWDGPKNEGKTDDKRCLEHDHAFDERMLYDDDYQPFPPEIQMQAKCWRCGITMGQSFERIRKECEQLLSGKVN